MAPLKALRLAILVVTNLLARPSVGTPVDESQFVLQPPDPGSDHAPAAAADAAAAAAATAAATSHRRLHGRFLHITDLHPDEYYKPHTSTIENIACHRGNGIAGAYGAETSDCDSPLSLVNATLTWVKEHLKDEIDFVVWTGDSARHDSDEKVPRRNKDVLAMNRRIADAFLDAFSDNKGLVVPVVPTFGNNDIYPHNILLPGPNNILQTYGDIWSPFIPEAQRNSFQFGGWFYVEVVPDRLAVVSLNTMYFFDRNAGIDDCVQPSEPGYKHFEWLDVQLNSLRARGMKAILVGHVPPARTPGKQLWEESCWQKYTLWLQQYRDVVVTSLYGHMNIDHFLFQDTKDIDLRLLDGLAKNKATKRETMGDGFSIQSRTDYLKELRDDWSKLPNPGVLEDDSSIGGQTGKGKKKKNKYGGKWAERFQLTLISPSVVPNYFPTIRVFEYNITGLENSPTWVDATRAGALNGTLTRDEPPKVGELKRRQDHNLEIEKKKKEKGGKGKKTPPKNPNLHVPAAPVKGTLPGPAYRPQSLSLLGYTQYYANLTEINNDIPSELEGDSMWSWAWKPGKYLGKTPQHRKPQPRKFQFEVEYNTFDDKIYKLKDLTVKNLVKLAYRIGQVSSKSIAQVSDGFDEDDDYDDEDGNDDEGENHDDDDNDDEDEDEDEVDNPDSSDFVTGGKKNKKDKKDRKDKKAHKVWLHFLKHAFVSTKSKKELKKL
ncbi:Endopolyphosphatase [Xylaria sp. CBS 124048]|nr:Endopolyphosphatase [Xylaria sp. CBS 124048]